MQEVWSENDPGCGLVKTFKQLLNEAFDQVVSIQLIKVTNPADEPLPDHTEMSDEDDWEESVDLIVTDWLINGKPYNATIFLEDSIECDPTAEKEILCAPGDSPPMTAADVITWYIHNGETAQPFSVEIPMSELYNRLKADGYVFWPQQPYVDDMKQ